MSMRRGIIVMITCLLFMTLGVSACNGKTPGNRSSEEKTGEGAQGQSAAISEDMQALLEEIDWDAQDEEAWQDNTLDAWMASTHQELSFKGMAGTKPLGRWVDDICMTPDGISVFMSRAFMDEDGMIPYLMERISCTRDGAVDDLIYAKGQNLSKPRVLAYGVVSGTDELWGNILSGVEEVYGKTRGQEDKDGATDKEGEGETAPRIFWQLKDNSTINKDGKSMVIRFLGQDSDSESVDCFILDKDGRLYILTSKYQYREIEGVRSLIASPGRCLYVASPDGELLYSENLVNESKDTAEPAFVTLPEGEVGISFFSGEGSNRKLTLFCYDEEKAGLKQVAALENSYLTNYALTISDAGKVISVDSGGVWESDPQGGERTQLYTWKEHGIRPRTVYGLCASVHETIDVLYVDADGMHYVSLKPVTEQREITELVMAATQYSGEKCKEAVMRFNQKYPSYHLTLKYDYDSTRLNSELITGNGPVLIDTNLTGFEELKDYWEPLDGVLEKMGLYEELEPKALEAGRIGAATYGIITDFYFETLITADPETKNWNYDSFLEYLQAHTERPYIYMDYDANCGSLFVYRFWQHGPNDGVILNVDKKENYVDTNRFRAILKLAKDKCQNQGKLDDKDKRTRLLEGETSFLLTYFFKPSDLALFRIVFGDEAYIVGEPMQDGAAHLLRSSDPITIRSAATPEEKKGALLFIRELLSYESQKAASKESNFKFSVRRDVLKECIMSLDSESYLDSNGYLGVPNVTKLGDKADPGKDYQKLLELLENAVPVTYLPKEVSGILWDELDPYFNETVSQSDTIRKLRNRINLYLQEQ